jgi:hypothetical protein
MPSVIDDVAEVVTTTIILSLPTVLSYPSTRVIVGQAPIADGRGFFFTWSILRPIGSQQRARPEGH